MESLACQEVTACPAEAPAPAAARSRQLAVAFQFDNLRGREKTRRPTTRSAIAVPAFSRIVYRGGAISVR
jgi:hypothetical protein